MDYRSLLQDPKLPPSKPTESFWQIPPNPTLLGRQSSSLPSQCDIAVVGSGISACSVVRELLTAGFKGSICLLEAREVCSGATGRNGGRIHVHAIQEYDKYSRMYGTEPAKRIIRFQLQAWEELQAVVSTLSPEQRKAAAFRETISVAAIFSQRKMETIVAMLHRFEAAFPDLEGMWKMLSAEEAQTKFKIKYAKGAMIGTAGAAWPYRFVTAIFCNLLEAYGDRFLIETQTPVLGVSKDANSTAYSIRTSRGVLRAQHVVYCTEGHTTHLLPSLRGILVPRRGQMTVQTPGQAFEALGGTRSWNFWFDRGFDYLHQNPTSGDVFLGSSGSGGFDAALDLYGIANDAEEDLLEKAHMNGIMPTVFGQEGWGQVAAGQQSIKASWSGIMLNSLDYVAMVGALPPAAVNGRLARDHSQGGEWISAGFGGHGMTNTWLCGVALARQILRQEIPSWLPEQYRISEARIERLQAKVKKFGGTEEHLRALL